MRRCPGQGDNHHPTHPLLNPELTITLYTFLDVSLQLIQETGYIILCIQLNSMNNLEFQNTYLKAVWKKPHVLFKGSCLRGTAFCSCYGTFNVSSTLKEVKCILDKQDPQLWKGCVLVQRGERQAPIGSIAQHKSWSKRSCLSWFISPWVNNSQIVL